MDNNYKYVETASDLNVEGVEYYIDGTTGKAYEDREFTVEAKLEDLLHYYETADLIFIFVDEENGTETSVRVNAVEHILKGDETDEQYGFFAQVPYLDNDTYTSRTIGVVIVVEEPEETEVEENEES